MIIICSICIERKVRNIPVAESKINKLLIINLVKKNQIKDMMTNE